MTPKQLEQEKQLAAKYRDKIQRGEPLQPIHESKDTKEFYHAINDTLYDLSLIVRGLRRVLQDHGDRSHPAVEYQLRRSEQWEHGKEGYDKIHDLRRTTLALLKEHEEEFFKKEGYKNLSSDEKRAILAYEYTTKSEGGTPTPEGREEFLQSWFGAAEEHRQAGIDAEQQANRETFWDRHFGQQPPAEPDWGEDAGR